MNKPHLRTGPDPFKEADVLLARCKDELDSLHVDAEDDKQVLVAMVYARAIHLFRGLLPLLRARHVYAGRVVARALLEAVFTGVALVREKRAMRRYVEVGEVARLKWINSLLNSPTIHVRGMSKASLRALKKRIEASVKRYDLKDLNTEDLARWAKMHDTYLREYALWSLTVHASERDFKDHLTVDSNGDLAAVDLHHTPEEALPILSTSSLAFLRLHQAAGELFAIDAGEIDTKFEPFFVALQEQFAAQDAEDDEGT